MLRKMLNSCIFLTIIFIILVGISQHSSGKTIDFISMAKVTATDVANVEKHFSGKNGAPIFIFEEMHTSRIGQIEMAIALNRLYTKFGLRDIALEGYTKESPVIVTDWFIKAAQGLTLTERAGVAAQILREGEISAVEFIVLLYDDILLHQIETDKEYNITLSAEGSNATISYLLLIAQQSLTEAHLPRIQKLQKEFTSAADDEKSNKAKALITYILSVDPWAQEKYNKLTDSKILSSYSAEEILEDVKKIKQRAIQVGVVIDKQLSNAMSENLFFWRSRVIASHTMVVETGHIADRPGMKLVALNIGAAHTNGVIKVLMEENRPFVVIRPNALSLGFMESDLDIESFDRKLKGLSVFSKGYMSQLLSVFPVRNQKKPIPVLAQDWFVAKGELYLFIRRITKQLLATSEGGSLPPMQPPGNPPKPPFGFSDDDFKGKLVYINPHDIEIIRDKENGSSRAVIFPAILNANESKKQNKIWIKAGILPAFTNMQIPSNEKESVEAILRHNLDEVRAEGKPDKKAEDMKGRIQIDVNTLAGFAEAKESAMSIPL